MSQSTNKKAGQSFIKILGENKNEARSLLNGLSTETLQDIRKGCRKLANLCTDQIKSEDQAETITD